MPLCDAARLHSRASSSLSHKYATLTHILSYYTLPRWSGCQSSFLSPLWHSIKVRIQRVRSSVGVCFCIVSVRIQTSLARRTSTEELKCIAFTKQPRWKITLLFLTSPFSPFSVRHWHSHDYANNVRLLYLLYVRRWHESRHLHGPGAVADNVRRDVFNNHQRHSGCWRVGCCD